MLRGRVLLQCGSLVSSYGEGKLLFLIRFVLVTDLNGHMSEHFVLVRSWLTPEERPDCGSHVGGPFSRVGPRLPSPQGDVASSSNGPHVDAAPTPRPVPGQLNLQLVPQSLRDQVSVLWQQVQDEPDGKLHAADIFCGRGNLTAAFRAFGMACACMDRATSPDTDDVLTDIGKGKLLQMVVNLAPGGVLWLAPECKSWIWLSRRTSKRCSENADGDTSVTSVAEANAVARLLADVCRTCYALGVQYVIENPRSSVLFTYPPIEAMLRATDARSVAVDLGRAGATSPKPLVLWGTACWLDRLAGTIRRRPALSQPRRLTEATGRFVNGKKTDLEHSAAYPRVFGTIVARAHAHSINHTLKDEREEEAVVVQIDSD